MNNFLEHDVLVKYTDAYLEKRKEWTWFVNELTNNYDLNDITSWLSFQNAYHLKQIYSYFIKVVQIDGFVIETDNPILRDEILLAEYFCGQVDINVCKEKLVSSFGKVMLLVIWIVRLENADNGTDFLYHMDIFLRHNYYELIVMSSLVLEQENILEYIHSIELDGFSEVAKCLEDNLSQVFYPLREGFIEKFRDNLLSLDCFSYQSITKEDNWSWEEAYLIDMLRSSVVNRKIRPALEYSGGSDPNMDLWTSSVLDKMCKYFSNPVADFVIESVRYMLYGTPPSSETICTHCKLYVGGVDNLPPYKKTEVSSYLILSYLFQDKEMGSVKGETDYILLIRKVQETTSVPLISKYADGGLPISKDQKQQLNSYYENLYKTVDDVKDVHEFLCYLRNRDVAKKIDVPYLIKTVDAFQKYSENKTDKMIPTLFYEFMCFLININATGLSVDKKLVQHCIIETQQLWEREYYSVISGNMDMHTFSMQIPSKDLEAFCNALINSPLTVATNFACSSENAIISVMQNTAENAIINMVSHMTISPIYPIEANPINYDRHEVDSMLRQIIEKINDKKAYKFLNHMDTDIHVRAFHERLNHNALVLSSMLIKEEDLYHKIENLSEYSLIPYSEKLTIAHITQLFPLLEHAIRKLAIKTGYVPFKEKMSEFMKFKDSSSVLREIIADAFSITGSFESVPDLFLIYNYMFNGNSLNIRNECIHGRNYLSGNSLRFGFRLTMIVINMLFERLRIIEQLEESAS